MAGEERVTILREKGISFVSGADACLVGFAAKAGDLHKRGFLDERVAERHIELLLPGEVHEFYSNAQREMVCAELIEIQPMPGDQSKRYVRALDQLRVVGTTVSPLVFSMLWDKTEDVRVTYRQVKADWHGHDAVLQYFVDRDLCLARTFAAMDAQVLAFGKPVAHGYSLRELAAR